MAFSHRHVVSLTQFSREDIETVLTRAAALKSSPSPEACHNRVLGTLFFEPSTRTRLSFEAAMQRLGGSVVGFADPTSTSAKKGESLADTVRIVAQYADVIAMRHPLEGAARLAADISPVPIINAGDGGNQHPSQTLLDLFTIRECQGKIDGLHIALMGDLKYGRGIHSLVQGLAHFDVHISFVAPESIQIPDSYKRMLDAAGVTYTLHERVDEILPDIDILYLTRIQEERYLDKAEFEQVRSAFYLTMKQHDELKESAKILHIMPRVREMDTAIDDSEKAYYFEQAKNGMYVRQALIDLVLTK